MTLLDRSPAAVEALFREAGAPWPARGELVFGSLYSTGFVLQSLLPWRLSFFGGTETVIEGPQNPENPWPAGTNLEHPHVYKHDIVVARVGVLFRSTAPGGVVPPEVERAARVTFWHGQDLVGDGSTVVRRLPRYVPARERFGVELRCDGRGPGPGPALQVQVLLDGVIVKET